MRALRFGIGKHMSVITPLKQNQISGVKWLCRREAEPKFGVYGGMLCDEAGMGKTLMLLSLICQSVEFERTLVIVPSNLINVWLSEIHKHTTIDNIAVYHGNRRRLLDVKDSKIIISTYGVLRNEFIKMNYEPESIFNQTFNRVILDEAHSIRTGKKTAFSTYYIKAPLRWAVTATPLINAKEENIPYRYFLGMFNSLIPFDMFKEELMLRRTKSVMELPPKEEITEMLDMTDWESILYKSLYLYSLKINLSGLLLNIKNYAEKLNRAQLVLIMRLRQMCVMPSMVIKQLSEEFGTYYQKSLANYDGSDCPVCLDNKADYINTTCGHLLCNACWCKLSECPYCRKDLGSIHSINQSTTTVTLKDMIENKVPTKIKRVLEIVEENIEQHKIVIVSQWLDVLDTLEKRLGEKHNVLRIDGKVSLNDRTRIIDKIQTDDNERIILMSMMCSAEGITLTSATLMVFVDQWWNKGGKMEQMSNRIHRIGQMNNTRIIHLKMRNTIEEEITLLHNYKLAVTDIDSVITEEIVRPNRLLVIKDNMKEHIVV